MTVEGTTEQVRRMRRERSVGGGVIGQEVTELFLSVKDGLPLRIRRYTHITTPVSMLGVSKIDFDNDGSDWLLRSRRPIPFAKDASTPDDAGNRDGGSGQDAGPEPSDAGSDDADDAG